MGFRFFPVMMSFRLKKSPAFRNAQNKSKKPGKSYHGKITNGNRNTDAADDRRIHERNNIILADQSHIVSPFCLKKCLARKRQDKRAASRCKLLFYLRHHIMEQISCQPNIANLGKKEHRIPPSYVHVMNILPADKHIVRSAP